MMKSAKTGEIEPIQPEAIGQIGDSIPGSEVVGVEKIRDLLFGNQMQDYDRRFSMLEERFSSAFGKSSRRQRAISAPSSRARKSKWSRLNPSFARRKTCAPMPIGRWSGPSATNDTVEKRLRSISEQLSRLERDHADRLTQEVQSLREEIRRRNDDLQRTIEKMFAELSSVKTDRNLLAGLFVEIARCLNQEVGPKSITKSTGEPARGWMPS
jgi:chromosome segregation ATPase